MCVVAMVSTRCRRISDVFPAKAFWQLVYFPSSGIGWFVNRVITPAANDLDDIQRTNFTKINKISKFKLRKILSQCLDLKLKARINAVTNHV